MPTISSICSLLATEVHHILNTPNRVCCLGAFSAALRLRPKTVRVSTGSITPSSHNLQITTN